MKDLTKLIVGNRRKKTFTDKEFAKLYEKHVKQNGFSGLGALTPSQILENGKTFQEVSKELAKDGSHEFEFQPIYEEGSNVMYSDSTLSPLGLSSILVTASATSYLMADALKKTKRPSDTFEIQDVIAISLSGLLVSYGLIGAVRKFTENIFEKNVKGVIALPQDSLNKEVSTEDRAKNIKQAVLKDSSYKESKITTTRVVNNLISGVNAFALAYHGYKRHGQPNQPADVQQYIWAGCWGLAGFYNLTNLGAAYAVGFAQPKGVPIGSAKPEIVHANARVVEILQAPETSNTVITPEVKKRGRKPKATTILATV